MNATLKNTFTKLKKLDFLSLIIAYIVLIVFFALTTQHFFTWSNFMNIMLYASTTGVLACTMALIIISGNIDLSVGAIIALSGVVIGIILKAGGNIWVALAASMAVAALTGLYNGLMIAYVKVNAFITTLAGMQIFRGAAYLISDGKTISVASSDVLKWVGRSYTLKVPHAAIIMVGMIVLFALIAKYLAFGRRIFVIGGSLNAAYLCGINVRRTLLKLFVVNGLVCGVATWIYCSQIGAAMPQSATGIEFKVISAVILGGASLSGGKGSIVGAMFGALLLGTLDNGMTMLNIQTFWQDVITGIVLILAVVLDILRNKKTAQAF
jgi:ribose/xylose/arabinose/galactoside ABC-type transport system permease subunit